jgi:HK97 family phage major capsid protein
MKQKSADHYAYSQFVVKSVDSEKRIIKGTATTPRPDRMEDIVEPRGVEYELPLPFLWQHDHDKPIGHVTKATVTSKGIDVEVQIEKTDEPGPVKDRLDGAWQDIKLRLVRGLSIGFKGLETARIEGTYGIRFLKWMWLELSAVTIAANGDCSIETIKSIDTQQRAASGRAAALPGVSGQSKPRTEGTKTMKTLDERISAKEAERTDVAAKVAAIWKTVDTESRDATDDEKLELKDLGDDLKEIDDHLVLLNGRKRAETSAKEIGGLSPDSGSRSRDIRLPAQVKAKAEPGIQFARYVRCMALAHKMHRDVLHVANELYGERDPEIIRMLKTVGSATPALTSSNSSALIGNEGGFADFAEYLRPRTIVGRFGTGTIPALRGIPFRVPLINASGKGTAYWVGEGKGKPLTKPSWARNELAPLKVAVITAATMETLRDSSPSAERLIRDDLTESIVERTDLSFIDPTNDGAANIEPAAITYDIAAMTVASGGYTADAVRADVRAAITKFIAANNPLTTGVWVMSAQTALALSMMVNDLGNREFPGISMNGGTFFELPVITSEHVGDYVVLVNAGDVFLGDEGGIHVDMSTEASLEMVAGDNDGPSQNSGSSPPVASSVVSMFQTNSVAFRAERTINWARRRTSAVALITGVTWGVTPESPS